MTAAKTHTARHATHGTRASRSSCGVADSVLRSLFERSDIPTFLRDADGRFLEVNGALAALLDHPAADLLGRAVTEVLPSDAAERHLAVDRQVLAEGGSCTIPHEVHEVGGRHRTFAVHVVPVAEDAGHPARGLVGGTYLDVTESVAGRREQFASSTRLRGVFENAPVGQIYSDIGGVIESVNDALATILGYRPDEMVGHNATEFVLSEDLEQLRGEVAALAAGDAQTISALRRFRHREGHSVPVRVTSWIIRDEDGVPATFASVVLDLTAEERTQAMLAEAHDVAVRSSRRMRLLRTLATTANDAETIAEHAIQVFGPVCSHFGWSAGALVQWRAGVARVVQGGGPDAGRMADLCAGLLPSDAPVTVLAPVDDTFLALVALASPDGERSAFVFATRSPISDEQRQVLALLAMSSSRVIERESSAHRMRDSETRFRAVFDSSPLPMGLTLGDSGTYYMVNDALCELVGRTPDELIGMSARQLVHPDDAKLTDPAGAAALAAPDGRSTTEVRLVHSSGRTIDAVVTLAWIDGPFGTRQLLAQIRDVTAERMVAEAQRRQAQEDPLTGLMNRRALHDAMLERAARGEAATALFVDLDGFQMINDTRGQETGDEVLVEVARRLRGLVRDGDLVARFGGDEFVVIVDLGEDSAHRVADRIQEAVSAPIHTRGGEASVTASIGMATGSIDVERPKQLVHRADAAMHRAKILGKNRREIYGAELHQRTMERQRTEAALRHALDEERFTLHYQPIVDLAEGEVTGFEALVRLVDADGELVPPGTFISVAEDSGLIVPMGDWVLQEACSSMVALRRRYGRPFTVAVNVAAQQVTRTDFAESVLAVLSDTGLPAEALTVELTESALLEADTVTLQQLTTLHQRGVAVGLDDFGTGYSSLAYLRSFPVSHIKVDRSFVSGMTTVSSDRAIVRSVVGLAEDLGLEWIAEGIETIEQRDALRGLGEHGQAQGYLFGRPVPLDELSTVLGPADRSRILRPVRLLAG